LGGRKDPVKHRVCVQPVEFASIKLEHDARSYLISAKSRRNDEGVRMDVEEAATKDLHL
jgi:hypothetical protein